MSQFKNDERPMRYGWAPGGYVRTCKACNERFIGDKRATICADCAYALPDPSSPPPAPTHAGEHSPVPWRSVSLFSHLDKAEIMDAEQCFIVGEINKANAAHIAACVNAFEGVSTQDVKSLGRVIDFLSIKKAQERRNELRQKLGESDAKAKWVDKWGEYTERVLLEHWNTHSEQPRRELRAILQKGKQV